MYCTVVRGLSGAPLYLTREGRRVDGTYENKPTNRKEQLKKSSQPTKETSAWQRPRKQNSYQISIILVCSSSLVPSFARMVLGRDQFPPRTTHPSSQCILNPALSAACKLPVPWPILWVNLKTNVGRGVRGFKLVMVGGQCFKLVISRPRGAGTDL